MDKVFAVFCFLLPYSLGDFTLLGDCPQINLQENIDYAKFSGRWYNVESYASDSRPIYDCSTFDFENDKHGYTLRETYVNLDHGNRTQKSYFARIDPTFSAGSRAQFMLSHEDNDKVLQFPFYILSTDYDGYAIAYTCKSSITASRQRAHNNDRSRIRVRGTKMHYVFTWILSRNKNGLKSVTSQNMEKSLSEYPELVEHRQSFVSKDFSEASCSYADKFESDFFTSNFW